MSALISQVEGERVVHVREFREFCNLVYALRPFHAAIDFLQADQIGMLRVNHSGNAGQVEFLIHADTDMNVVSHDAHRAGVGGNGRRRCRSRVNAGD